MGDMVVRGWKKVLESDLCYIVEELRGTVEPPAVIILSGPMGIGKTTFTKYFVKNYSTKDFLESCTKMGSGQVVSPTYSLINDYGETIHGDFYRLEGPEEIAHLELGVYLEQTDYFLVEWGRAFLHELEREIPEKFKVYELEIKLHAKGHLERDFLLREF